MIEELMNKFHMDIYGNGNEYQKASFIVNIMIFYSVKIDWFMFSQSSGNILTFLNWNSQDLW